MWQLIKKQADEDNEASAEQVVEQMLLNTYSSHERIRIGDLVELIPKRRGVVAYIGQTRFAKNPQNIYFGIALTRPRGKHNGTVDGYCYFTADKKCGVFVNRKKIKRVLKSGMTMSKYQAAKNTNVGSAAKSTYSIASGYSQTSMFSAAGGKGAEERMSKRQAGGLPTGNLQELARHCIKGYHQGFNKAVLNYDFDFAAITKKGDSLITLTLRKADPKKAVLARSKIVADLIILGANLDHKNADEDTGLHIAIRMNLQPIIDVLIQAKPPPNPHLLNKSKESPLSLCIENSRWELVDLLLQKGNEYESADSEAQTLFACFQLQKMDIVQKIMDRRRFNDQYKDADGNSIIHVVPAALVKGLVTAKSDLNVTNDDGESPLFRTDPDVVQLLADGNADLEHKNESGLTPLAKLLRNVHMENPPVSPEDVRDMEQCASILIRAGANFTRNVPPNKMDLPPFYAAIFYNRPIICEAMAANGAKPNDEFSVPFKANRDPKVNSGQMNVNALQVACGALDTSAVNRPEVIRIICGMRQCIPGVRMRNRWSAQDIALDRKAMLNFAALIECGGDVDAFLQCFQQGFEKDAMMSILSSKPDLSHADSKGNTALVLATQYRTENQMEKSWLVKALIDGKCDVNKANRVGMTPLMLSAQAKQLGEVRLLLDAKAKPDVVAKNGQFPLLFALRPQAGKDKERLAVAKCLVEGKADVNKKCVSYGMTARDGFTPLMHAVGIVGYADRTSHEIETQSSPCLDGRDFPSRNEIIEMLLDANADANATSGRGDTALHMLMKVKSPSKGGSLLQIVDWLSVVTELTIQNSRRKTVYDECAANLANCSEITDRDAIVQLMKDSIVKIPTKQWPKGWQE